MSEPDSVEAWRASAPAVGEATCAQLARGEELLAALPLPTARTPTEADAAARLSQELAERRAAFLRTHIDEIYDELTEARRSTVRVADLVTAAAVRYPGLVPSTEALER